MKSKLNLDTIEIIGKPSGQEMVCKGNECKEMNCSPIIIGGKYDLLGKFNRNSTRKTFIVEDYKLLN